MSPLSAVAQQRAPLVQIRPVVVTPEEFRVAYPKVQAWIQKTLAAYEKDRSQSPRCTLRACRYISITIC